MYHEISLYDDMGQFYAVSGSQVTNEKVIGRGDTPQEALQNWATKNQDIDVPESYLD